MFVEDSQGTTFTLRGVVVDEAIVPVAGITVSLFLAHQALASVTTDANGAFSFAGLTENIYRLRAHGPEHGLGEIQVDVPAMVDDTIRLQVLSQLPPTPLFSVTKWDGMVHCSQYTILIRGGGSCFYRSLLGEDWNGTHMWRSFWSETTQVGQTVSHVRFEAHWKPNQIMGESLRFNAAIVEADGYSVFGPTVAMGPSPQALAWDNATAASEGLGTTHGIMVGAWAGTDDPLMPGVTFEQPFTGFYSVMHNAVPPADWSFGADGAPW